jgi:hypothetical protein
MSDKVWSFALLTILTFMSEKVWSSTYALLTILTVMTDEVWSAEDEGFESCNASASSTCRKQEKV